MNHRRFEFLSGIFLTLSVSPIWYVALGFLIYIFARKRPTPIFRISPYLILLVTTISASALAVAVLNLSPFVSLGATGSFTGWTEIGSLVGRVLTIGILISSFVSWKIYRKSTFWHGVLLVVIIHGALMLFQHIPGINAGYARGFQGNSSLAGLFGAIGMASPVSHFAGLSLALSHSRSYILATFLIGLWNRNRQILVCSIVALVIVWTVDSNRVNWTVYPGTPDGSISESIESHIFYTPAPWHSIGYGYANFNEATGFGQPHNIFVLAWYELGLFLIPFAAFISYIIYRLKLWHFLPLIIGAGMFTPELFAWEQSVGGLAIYHLGILHSKEKKGLRWWQQ